MNFDRVTDSFYEIMQDRIGDFEMYIHEIPLDYEVLQAEHPV